MSQNDEELECNMSQNDERHKDNMPPGMMTNLSGCQTDEQLKGNMSQHDEPHKGDMSQNDKQLAGQRPK